MQSIPKPSLKRSDNGLALLAPWVAQLVFVAVALLWLVADRRIERALQQAESACA